MSGLFQAWREGSRGAGCALGIVLLLFLVLLFPTFVFVPVAVLVGWMHNY